MTVELEVVMDLAVAGEELLCVADRLESLYAALAVASADAKPRLDC